MTFKKRATKSIALALVGVTIATPILNTSYAYSQNINTIKEDSDKGIENDLYAEKETETINIDGVNYTYKYYYKDGNRGITITNNLNDVTEEILFDESTSTAYLNGEATMTVTNQESVQSASARAYYVWETKSSEVSYISWLKAVTVSALIGMIIVKLGGVVGAAGGGTVYNKIQMFRAPLTNPQYRTVWAFKASTGDRYGDYIYLW